MASLVAVIAVVAAACGAPAPATPTADWAFEAYRVHVHDSTDGVWGVGEADEPYVVNVAFRVKVGVPGSAQAWSVRGTTHHDLEPGEQSLLTGSERARVSFPGLEMVDVDDILRGEPLEVVGVWSWAMEEDVLSLGDIDEDAARAIQNLLNRFMAGGSLPQSTLEWAAWIVDQLGVSGVLNALRVNLGFLFGGDDPIGSRVFVGLPVRGSLGAIIDQEAPKVAIPAIDLPGAIPPSVGGGVIARLGHHSTATMSARMQRGNGDHQLWWTWLSTSGWGTEPTPTIPPVTGEPECIPDRLNPNNPPICPI